MLEGRGSTPQQPSTHTLMFSLRTLLFYCIPQLIEKTWKKRMDYKIRMEGLKWNKDAKKTSMSFEYLIKVISRIKARRRFLSNTASLCIKQWIFDVDFSITIFIFVNKKKTNTKITWNPKWYRSESDSD